MADLTLYLECEATSDSTALEGQLRAGLQRVAKLASAETTETTTRFTGVEILVGITLVAGVIHQGATIVHDIRQTVNDLKAIFKDVSELTKKLMVKKVRIPVGLVPKAIDELTDEDYETIAQELASGAEGE
jgi:hypothetical protein